MPGIEILRGVYPEPPIEILRGVYPEPPIEILRCAQNDRGEGLRMTGGEGLGLTPKKIGYLLKMSLGLWLIRDAC